MVVMAIIAILATAGLSAYTSYIKKTQIFLAKQDMEYIIKGIVAAQGQSEKYLQDITNSGCSWCNACGWISLKNSTGNCYLYWVTAITKIQSATGGIFINLDTKLRDPWWSPYLLDENEGALSCSGYDQLVSAGPDGIFTNNGDDIKYVIPHSICPN